MTSEYTYSELLLLKNKREEEVEEFQKKELIRIQQRHKEWNKLSKWKKFWHILINTELKKDSATTNVYIKSQKPSAYDYDVDFSTDWYGNGLINRLNAIMPDPDKTAFLNESERKLFTTPFTGALYWVSPSKALLLEDLFIYDY